MPLVCCQLVPYKPISRKFQTKYNPFNWTKWNWKSSLQIRLGHNVLMIITNLTQHGQLVGVCRNKSLNTWKNVDKNHRFHYDILTMIFTAILPRIFSPWYPHRQWVQKRKQINHCYAALFFNYILIRHVIDLVVRYIPHSAPGRFNGRSLMNIFLIF